MSVVLLALRGAASVIALTTLVGGIPRIVQAALAASLGLWCALLLPPVAGAAPTWALAVQEVAIGAAIGIVAAVPLLAAAAAGRLVDVAATGRAQGTYGAFFGLLSAAVFVGIDGHIAFARAIVESHRAVPILGSAVPGVLGALARIVPAAIQLAIPWLVTAAVVQVAIGVGSRVATRAVAHAPTVAAVPAALAMMTASLVGTLAVALAALVRGTS
jgi:flagellar biosynthesis protein FliR